MKNVKSSARRARRLAASMIVVSALLGCEAGSAPAIAVVVDSTVEPELSAIPGTDGTPEGRPLAAVRSSDGPLAQFVEAEVILVAASDDEAAAFAMRWNGEVTGTLEGDPGVGLERMYLVTIDPERASPAALAADLSALAPGSRSELRVSSERGLRTLAAAAAEASSGASVGVNWVASGSDFRGRQTADVSGTATDSCGGGSGMPSHGANAFEWPYIRNDGPLGIGVGEAWRALSLAGRLSGPRIGVAIIDGGLHTMHPDYPLETTTVLNPAHPVPIPPGSVNTMQCGGSPCPFHGTGSALTAFGRADNGFGAAGPAGPVAAGVLIATYGDMFTVMGALARAWLARARIASMSFGAPIPWTLEWSVLPFDRAAMVLRQNGLLIFASAGNDGSDVDAEVCDAAGTCVEHTHVYPCENTGVLCVGATNIGDPGRAFYSSWGSAPTRGGPNPYRSTVDLFAPGWEYIARLPPLEAMNGTETFCGTSSATPFAAGVAALVWAADPLQTAGDVEDRLLRFATLTSADRSVPRYVDAYAPVIDALGGAPNSPPSITFVSPAAGAVLEVGTATFITDASDEEDGLPSIVWTSDVDGPIAGTGATVSVDFTTPGRRRITATAIDRSDARASAEVEVDVQNTPPTAFITTPTDGGTVYLGQSTVLRGRATDPGAGELPCTRLRWSAVPPVAGDVGLPSSGCNVTVSFGSNGPRTIELSATDALGASGLPAVITLSVVDPPSDPPPAGTILSPSDAQHIADNMATVTLTATVSNDPPAQSVSVRWIAEWNDGSARSAVVGTSALASFRPIDIGIGCGTIFFPVRLRLELDDGVTTVPAADSVGIVLDCPPP